MRGWGCRPGLPERDCNCSEHLRKNESLISMEKPAHNLNRKFHRGFDTQVYGAGGLLNIPVILLEKQDDPRLKKLLNIKHDKE